MIAYLTLALATLSADPQGYDVVVYGATPAGIAAAIAAADDGEKVLLIEPTTRIGGMVTNGLSHTDYHAHEGMTGAFLEFSKRVEKYYIDKYGKDSTQVKASFRGTFGEPSVNLKVFEQMLAERKNIVIVKRYVVLDVKLNEGNRITEIVVQDWDVRSHVKGSYFIDATYEGDLLAKAGVKYRVGREAGKEYDESLAPEVADKQLQAYNFRFIMTNKAENRVMPKAPQGYKRDDFLPVVEILKSGQIKTIFGYPSGCIFKAQTPALPSDKYDINDVSRSIVRLSLPGVNADWPDGGASTRQKIFDAHLRDQVGLLYFLQNDDAVPEKFRKEAREWGWCKDEFTDSGHLPQQLYVREARRMEGKYIYTQKDSEPQKADARAMFHRDSIAIGEYGNNCHGTAHEGPRFGGKHTGEFYHATPPYQIPYGVIVPKNHSNLLVPVAVSASHVGYCALRLEPIWMQLGQSAGHAAHLARKGKVAVQEVPVPALQARLHKAGSATIYVGDIPPGHADFALAQWWGTAGGFHGLHLPPEKIRGKTIHGQYLENYPKHDAELGKVLDAKLAEQWSTLAKSLKIKTDGLPNVDGRTTRREWLVYAQDAWIKAK